MECCKIGFDFFCHFDSNVAHMPAAKAKVSATPSQPTPGEVLRLFFMQPLDLSAYRLAKDLGVEPIAISQILRGRRSISAALAIKLGEYFGVEAGFWLSLQGHFDVWKALRARRRVIPRCPALEERRFVLREAKGGDSRSWQVLLTKAPRPGDQKSR